MVVTTAPIQVCIDTRAYQGVPLSSRPEDRGHRLHFLTGGELWDWLRWAFGTGWRLERPLVSSGHASWKLVVSDGPDSPYLVGTVHAYRRPPPRLPSPAWHYGD